MTGIDFEISFLFRFVRLCIKYLQYEYTSLFVYAKLCLGTLHRGKNPYDFIKPFQF